MRASQRGTPTRESIKVAEKEAERGDGHERV
jgi:hypothetical protein